MYRIVVITDPYHGSHKVGFKYTKNRDKMYKVLDEGMTLEEARKELFRILKSKAENHPQYWECETLEEAAKVEDDEFCVRDNGHTASFSYDVCRYVLDSESNPFSIVVKEYSRDDIESKLRELLDNGATILDEAELDRLDAYYATEQLRNGWFIKIDSEYYDEDEFIETFLK